MPKMSTLHCQAGHDWQRESKRGRPPLWCPEHQPVENKPVIKRSSSVIGSGKDAGPVQPAMRWICCEGNPAAGIEPHMFQQESRRGRLPKHCPTHAAEMAQKSPKKIVSNMSLSRAIEAVLEKPRSRTCTCGLTPATSAEEIAHMVTCCEPQFICPNVDTVRRTISV